MTTLILYILLSGQMTIVRIPQDTMAQCEANRIAVGERLGAMHAECKTKKAKG